MSSESDLRDAIRSSADKPTTGIDTDAVLRRARARRVPRQIAFSSLSVLAIAGIATVGFNLIPALVPGGSTVSESSTLSMAPEASVGASTDSARDTRPGSTLAAQNLCGRPTPTPTPNSAGLALSTSFPDTAPADGHDVVGTVTITNVGGAHVSGTTAVAPTVILSRDGTTVWHSHGSMIMMAVNVDLAPGESFSYAAHFTPVECGPLDEEGLFRSDLPALNAGSYQVMAEIVFVPDSASVGESILVSGPAHSIELR